jgi:Rrf2 family protein
MKISTKVECGIIALIDIALNSMNGDIVTVNSISKRHNISVKYLEQILPSLRQANLIKSQKGSRGGYIIALSYKDITFKDILNALDVNILSDAEFDLNEKDGYAVVVNELLWNNMNNYLRKYAEKITLDDAVQYCNEVCCSAVNEPMYYI